MNRNMLAEQESPDWNPARDEGKLRQLTQSSGGVPSRWVRMMAAELLRLRATLQLVASYNPGNFRPLEDEVAIWRLAADAPGSTSEASHRADPTDWLAYLEAKPECEPYLSIARAWRVDKAEILRLMRGEFICSRCYLRKDGESDDVVTF